MRMTGAGLASVTRRKAPSTSPASSASAIAGLLPSARATRQSTSGNDSLRRRTAWGKTPPPSTTTAPARTGLPETLIASVLRGLDLSMRSPMSPILHRYGISGGPKEDEHALRIDAATPDPEGDQAALAGGLAARRARI